MTDQDAHAVARDALSSAIEQADNGDGTLNVDALHRALTEIMEEHWLAAQSEWRDKLAEQCGKTLAVQHERDRLRAAPSQRSEAEVEARAYFEAYRGTGAEHWQLPQNVRHAEALIAALDEARAAIGELEQMVSDCEEARDNARMESAGLREVGQRIMDQQGETVFRCTKSGCPATIVAATTSPAEPT